MSQTTRRRMGYWDPFNNWWRDYVAKQDKRPKVHDMKKWFDENAQQAWGGQGPTWEETKKHSKGMRRIEEVSNYFREYRKERKRKAAGVTADDSFSSGSDSDPDAGRPKASKQQTKGVRTKSARKVQLTAIDGMPAPGSAPATTTTTTLDAQSSDPMDDTPLERMRAASASQVNPVSSSSLSRAVPGLPNLGHWLFRASSMPSSSPTQPATAIHRPLPQPPLQQQEQPQPTRVMPQMELPLPHQLFHPAGPEPPACPPAAATGPAAAQAAVAPPPPPPLEESPPQHPREFMPPWFAFPPRLPQRFGFPYRLQLPNRMLPNRRVPLPPHIQPPPPPHPAPLPPPQRHPFPPQARPYLLQPTPLQQAPPTGAPRQAAAPPPLKSFPAHTCSGHGQYPLPIDAAAAGATAPYEGSGHVSNGTGVGSGGGMPQSLEAAVRPPNPFMHHRIASLQRDHSFREEQPDEGEGPHPDLRNQPSLYDGPRQDAAQGSRLLPRLAPGNLLATLFSAPLYGSAAAAAAVTARALTTDAGGDGRGGATGVSRRRSEDGRGVRVSAYQPAAGGPPQGGLPPPAHPQAEDRGGGGGGGSFMSHRLFSRGSTLRRLQCLFNYWASGSEESDNPTGSPVLQPSSGTTPTAAAAAIANTAADSGASGGGTSDIPASNHHQYNHLEPDQPAAAAAPLPGPSRSIFSYWWHRDDGTDSMTTSSPPHTSPSAAVSSGSLPPQATATAATANGVVEQQEARAAVHEEADGHSTQAMSFVQRLFIRWDSRQSYGSPTGTAGASPDCAGAGPGTSAGNSMSPRFQQQQQQQPLQGHGSFRLMGGLLGLTAVAEEPTAAGGGQGNQFGGSSSPRPPGGGFAPGSWLLGKRSRESCGGSPASGSPRRLQRGLSDVFRPLLDMVSLGRNSRGSNAASAAAAAARAVAEVDAEAAAAAAAAAGGGAVAVTDHCTQMEIEMEMEAQSLPATAAPPLPAVAEAAAAAVGVADGPSGVGTSGAVRPAAPYTAAAADATVDGDGDSGIRWTESLEVRLIQELREAIAGAEAEATLPAPGPNPVSLAVAGAAAGELGAPQQAQVRQLQGVAQLPSAVPLWEGPVHGMLGVAAASGGGGEVKTGAVTSALAEPGPLPLPHELMQPFVHQKGMRPHQVSSAAPPPAVEAAANAMAPCIPPLQVLSSARPLGVSPYPEHPLQHPPPMPVRGPSGPVITTGGPVITTGAHLTSNSTQAVAIPKASSVGAAAAAVAEAVAAPLRLHASFPSAARGVDLAPRTGPLQLQNQVRYDSMAPPPEQQQPALPCSVYGGKGYDDDDELRLMQGVERQLPPASSVWSNSDHRHGPLTPQPHPHPGYEGVATGGLPSGSLEFMQPGPNPGSGPQFHHQHHHHQPDLHLQHHADGLGGPNQPHFHPYPHPGHRDDIDAGPGLLHRFSSSLSEYFRGLGARK